MEGWEAAVGGSAEIESWRALAAWLLSYRNGAPLAR